MFQKIKNKYRKRQTQKIIENYFQIARSVFPNVNQSLHKEIVQAIKELLLVYHDLWGADEYVAFYLDRLNEFRVIYDIKE